MLQIVTPLLVIKARHRELIQWRREPPDAKQRNAGNKEHHLRRKTKNHRIYTLGWIDWYYGNMMRAFAIVIVKISKIQVCHCKFQLWFAAPDQGATVRG